MRKRETEAGADWDYIQVRVAHSIIVGGECRILPCVLSLPLRIRVTISCRFLLVMGQVEIGRTPETVVCPSYNRLGYILKRLGAESFQPLDLLFQLEPQVDIRA